MTFGDFLKAVLTTRKVWEALAAFVGAILVVVKPDFPPEVWATFLAVVGAILTSVGIVEARATARRLKSERFQRELNLMREIARG